MMMRRASTRCGPRESVVITIATCRSGAQGRSITGIERSIYACSRPAVSLHLAYFGDDHTTEGLCVLIIGAGHHHAGAGRRPLGAAAAFDISDHCEATICWRRTTPTRRPYRLTAV